MVRAVGLLGGSFDPVHVGHLALARAALNHLPIAHVVLLPAGQPWQRQPLSASNAHRLHMLSLACGDDPALRIDTQELDRDGPTYTLDTLRARHGHPDDVWLMGADQLANFCSWHGWQEIAQRVRLAVARRPGSDLAVPAPLQDRLDALARPLLTIPMPALAISATDIRRRLAAGLPTHGLLHPAVAAYIEQQGLYRAPPGQYTDS